MSCKNRPILSAKIEHVLSSTILLADFLYIRQQMQKKVMQVLFCDLHSAVVLADIVRSSKRKYQPCVMVHRFCRSTKPRPQKSGNCRSSEGLGKM